LFGVWIWVDVYYLETGCSAGDSYVAVAERTRRRGDGEEGDGAFSRFGVVGCCEGWDGLGVLIRARVGRRCAKPAELQCPKCKELGLSKPESSFCSQDCFKEAWATHKGLHNWKFCTKRGKVLLAVLSPPPRSARLQVSCSVSKAGKLMLCAVGVS
jgi:hypothetical protein